MTGFFNRTDGRAWRTRLILALLCCGLATTIASARTSSRLIPQDALQKLSLKRAWFAQAQLDTARNHIERAILTGDRLTVLTSAGVVEEFNALTGESLWTASIGNELYPSLGPAVNDKFVALVNGSTLYVLDRKDGKPLIICAVGGAPGAAPALSDTFVYVPLVSGRIEGYPLGDDKKVSPWFYQSAGKAIVAPLATPKTLVWTTDAGNLYVAASDTPRTKFRRETGVDILAPPSYLKPHIFISTAHGDVYALDESTGAGRWKYSSGFSIERPAAPVGKRVFVTSDEPALHCIDAETGDALWYVPNMTQFSAISKSRVYGVDELGALVVLDAKTGSIIERFVADRPIKSLVNQDTDRLYLISADGMIECLHEIDAREPLRHNPQVEEPKKPAADEKAAGEKSAPPAKGASPPTSGATPPEKAATPEQPSQPEKPAGDFGAPQDDNPFGN